MNQVVFTSSLLTLVMAVVAIFLVWGCLRLLDYLIGFDFKEWLENEKDFPTAVYLGLRFVGACLLVGQLFS